MLTNTVIPWLDGLWIASVIRNSAWMLPTVETIHLASYAVIFGALITQTLRAFGRGIRETSVADLRLQLYSWMLGGFVTSVATGVLLLLYEPSRFLTNRFFVGKAGLIAAAAVFEFAGRGRLGSSQAAQKRATAASGMLWLGVALAGLALSLT
jgi:hypothetical protein